MKSFFKILTVALAAFSLSGCSDFLEENNKTNFTTDVIYSTADGVESLVNSCYTPIRFWYGKEGGYAFTELGTDIILAASGCTHTPLAQYHPTDLNGTNSNSKAYWERFYAAVNYCNMALQYIPDSQLDETVKTRRQGEVHFLRAFYLWHIVETWGNVYLSLEANTDPVTTATRTAVEGFYDQIMEDLSDAVDLLKNVTANDGGRVTLHAAKAFKARMLLTRASASYINNSNRANDYAEAAVLAKEVIGSGNFELAQDYASIWSMDNSDGDLNKEVVWFVNYTQNFTITSDIPQYESSSSFRKEGGHQAHLHFCMKYDDQPGMTRDPRNGRPFNRYMPSLHYLQLFDATIDQRYAGSLKMAWYANSKDKVEAAQAKDYPGMTLNDTSIFIVQGIATDQQKALAKNRYQLLDSKSIYDNGHDKVLNNKQTPQLSKFDDPTRSASDETRSKRDAFVIRIAEMYLIVAEAEMDSNPAEALSHVNILRKKRAIPGKEADMEVTASDLNIDFILAERARELGGEQLRWFDLKRTGKLLEYVQTWNPDGKANIKDYHTVRPIPQSQLDAVTNKDEFKQNPGYN